MDASTPALQSRTIRVFISSTFRDMMWERDLLVKEVFPELRRKCAKRFVTFTEVDLRWGITEAQANEGQVLPLCLAEIERSRPYFIGLLGERYGWIPDTIRPEVIAREPWLREHVQGRTSVTELEILHGVLNNPQMQSHAFFYFRDPAYVINLALTDDERRDKVERDIKADVEQHGGAEATRRTEERKAKLAALKQRIRDSKLPLVEPYASPKALAEIVRKQFDELIDRLYPEDQTPDLLAQERMAHEAHAKNKLFACIDRPTHLAALNAFVVGRVSPHGGLGGGAETPGEGTGPTKAGQGLVVTGESGGGKTALLAAWARDWTKNYPEDFLFQHYFGATPDSASPEGFLRRLLGELKSHFGIRDDIPTDSEKLRGALPVWLAQASASLRRSRERERVAEGQVRADGEKQISGSEGRGRIILVLDGLNQVQGTEPDRRLNFLPRYFLPHVVVFTSALPGPALDTLRERGWTEHDLPRASEAEVDAMVGEYLKIHARTLEPELRHQLVTAPGAKNPLFLRTVLEELRQFGSFEQLPQRVRHYLEADNPKDLFMRVLTRWQEDFDGKDPEQDKPNLDLVRLIQALNPERKDKSDFILAGALHEEAQALQRLGRFEEALGRLNEAEEISRATQDWHTLLYVLKEKCDILLESGQVNHALPCVEEGVHIAREHQNSRFLGGFLQQQAHALRLQGDLNAAHAALRQAEDIVRTRGDLRALAQILGKRALLFTRQGRYKEAWACHEEEATISRDLNELHGVSSALFGQTNILKLLGEYSRALELLDRVEKNAQVSGQRNLLAKCYGTRAAIFQEQGKSSEALELHCTEEALFREIGDSNGLAVALANQAILLGGRLNREDKARAIAKEALGLAQQGGQVGLSRQIEKLLRSFDSH